MQASRGEGGALPAETTGAALAFVGDAVADAVDSAELPDGEVYRKAGPAVLIATRRRVEAAPARQPVAVQDAADCRTRHADGQESWTAERRCCRRRSTTSPTTTLP